MKKSVPSRPALERPGCQDRTFSAVHQTGVHDEQTDDAAKKARLPFRVKLRNTQHEQMSSALAPIADILGGRTVRLRADAASAFHNPSLRESNTTRMRSIADGDNS